MKKLLRYFDRLEDKIRGSLSHHPIIYGMIAAFGVVLFWRGVEMIADDFSFMSGPMSLLISFVILSGTGVFVSFFIGDSIIISGLRKEGKLIERTEVELEQEIGDTDHLKQKIDKIEKSIEEIKILLQK